jgi:hypothetical protein
VPLVLGMRRELVKARLLDQDPDRLAAVEADPQLAFPVERGVGSAGLVFDIER